MSFFRNIHIGSNGWPQLPLLTWLSQETQQRARLNLAKVRVIAVQHLLPTTGTLFEYHLQKKVWFTA